MQTVDMSLYVQLMLKDKEQMLSVIEVFLSSAPIASDQLNSFIQQHPHIASLQRTLPTTDSEQSLTGGNTAQPVHNNDSDNNNDNNDSGSVIGVQQPATDDNCCEDTV